MNFSLTSFVSLSSACSQYYIDNSAPVKLTLLGPESHCELEAIQDPKLKETVAKVGIGLCSHLKAIYDPQLKAVLVKVGSAFERKERGLDVFFNVHHHFTPSEAIDNKDSDTRIDEEHTRQVHDIFAFVKTAINEQTNGNLSLDLTDVAKLTVSKAEDVGFLCSSRRAYELEVRLSEKAVEAAKKSGIVFQKTYGFAPQPAGTRTFAVGVGQDSIF